MKFALGTVQFGLAYGVANTGGQVAPDEIAAILQTARASGIDTIDTAIAYGQSEERLGAAGVTDFKVVSKLPPGVSAPDIRKMVEGSLGRLGVGKLHGLLLHRAGDLDGVEGGALYESLVTLKSEGLVEKVGVSIYDPNELDTLIDRCPPDLVQAPYNVIDRRLAKSGWLDRLKRERVEVHTRSAFLQGLLLMPPSLRPARFAPWQNVFVAWDNWLESSGQTALEATLSFVAGHRDIGRVVIGVDSHVQLEHIAAVRLREHADVPAEVGSDDLALINPSNWPKAS